MLLKETLPGSIPFLMIAFLVGLFFLQRPSIRRWGHRWIWGLFVLYLGFSMPAVGRLLATPLTWGFAPLQSVEKTRGAEAIVVLDGGTFHYSGGKDLLEVPNGISALRALEAARVYRLLGDPLVIVSGGDRDPTRKQNWEPEASALRDALMTLGVASRHIVLDSKSPDTRAHALNMVHLLRQRGITKFVLVTSPTHMRRAMLAFRGVGSDPIPSPSGSVADDKRGWKAFWPSSEGLVLVQQAMHDYLGLVWYGLQGWL